MGDVQTHRLDGRSHGKVGVLLVVIRRKQDALLVCLQHLGIAGADFLRRIKAGELFHNLRRTDRRKRRLHIVQHVIGQLVHHMDATAVDIQHNIIIAQFILMDHYNSSFYNSKSLQRYETDSDRLWDKRKGTTSCPFSSMAFSSLFDRPVMRALKCA